MNDQTETAAIRDLGILYAAEGKAEALMWTKIPGCDDYDIGAETPGGNIAVIEKIHVPRNSVCTFEFRQPSRKIAWAVRVVTVKGPGPWSDFVAEKRYLPDYPAPEALPPKASPTSPPQPTPQKASPVRKAAKKKVPEKPLPPAAPIPPLLPPPPAPKPAPTEAPKPAEPKKWHWPKKIMTSRKAKVILILILISAAVVLCWNSMPSMFGKTGQKPLPPQVKVEASSVTSALSVQNAPALFVQTVSTVPQIQTSADAWAAVNIPKKITADITLSGSEWISVPPTNYVDGTIIKKSFASGESLKFRIRKNWMLLTDIYGNPNFVRENNWAEDTDSDSEYPKHVTLTYRPPPGQTNVLPVSISFFNLKANH